MSEHKDVIRVECSFVDESDMPEHLRKEHRVRCVLKSTDFDETVFVDSWSFHDASMVASAGHRGGQDYDFVATFPGDCEKKMFSGETTLTCDRE